MTLHLGAVTQQIELTAGPPALKTENAGLGQDVTYQQVQSLPEFSRSGGLMIALAPGVRFTADDVISCGTRGTRLYATIATSQKPVMRTNTNGRIGYEL